MILNYSDLLEMSETDPGYRSFRSGQDYFRSGDYNEAIKCFQHAIKSVPNFAVAYNFLGFAYLAQGSTLLASQFFGAEVIREKGVNTDNIR